MDVCLTSYGHCNYVSGKHACIFYDEVRARAFLCLACMAVGAGDTGSRLPLCGAPLWDCKVGARAVNGFAPWRLRQRFVSNPFLKHRALPAWLL